MSATVATQRAASSGPSRFRGVPAGLIGALALVCATEATLAHGWEFACDTVSFSWRWSAAAAEREARDCSLLVLGDSLAKHGVVPAVLEAETGDRAFNLAASAAPAPWTYFLLERALAAGARPRAVVLEFKPSLLAGGPNFRARNWPEVLTPRESLDLIRATRSHAFAADLLLQSFLPSFRSRHELRASVQAALGGDRSRVSKMNQACQRNWSINAGANLARPRAGHEGVVSEAEHKELLSHQFRAHRVNAAYIDRVLALAQRHGIEVYVLLPPTVPAVRGRRAETGAEAKFETYVRGLGARFPRLTILDAREIGFDADVFVDPIHLDRVGARELSGAIGRAIVAGWRSPRRGESRWVALPRVDTLAEMPGLEDLEESRERLGLSWQP